MSVESPVERYKSMRIAFDPESKALMRPGGRVLLHAFWEGFDHSLCWRAQTRALVIVDPDTFIGGSVCPVCQRRMLEVSRYVDDVVEWARVEATSPLGRLAFEHRKIPKSER